MSVWEPQPGDRVVMYDEFREELKVGIIDSSSAYPDGLLMVVCDASAFRPRNQPTHVSCSGGPCPGVKPDSLRHIGYDWQRFWDWKDIPRAGGGVDYHALVRIWVSSDPI